MLLHQGLVFIFMLLVSILSVSVICCFKGVCRWFFFVFISPFASEVDSATAYMVCGLD
jgi:hypothetical protein